MYAPISWRIRKSKYFFFKYIFLKISLSSISLIFLDEKTEKRKSVFFHADSWAKQLDQWMTRNGEGDGELVTEKSGLVKPSHSVARLPIKP